VAGLEAARVTLTAGIGGPSALETAMQASNTALGVALSVPYNALDGFCHPK